jgi:RecA-family ATPase
MVNAQLIGQLPLGSERGVLLRVMTQHELYARAVELGVSVDAFSGARSRIWQTVEQFYREHPQTPPGYRALREMVPDYAKEELESVLESVEHAADFEGMATVLVDVARDNERSRELKRALLAAESGQWLEAQEHLERSLDISRKRELTPFDLPFETLAEDWFHELPPVRPWLLKDRDGNGVLPLAKAAALIAAGGVGKTIALIQLAISVATGRDWLGHFRVASPGMVCLALAEEDIAEIRRRIYTVGSSLELTADERAIAASRIVALPLSGTDVRFTDDEGARTANLNMFRERLCARSDWKLIVLDPLSRFAGGETEKDNSVATRFVEALESLTTVPGNPTVLVAHHTAKWSRREAQQGSAASRGVTGLTDGVRWVATIESTEAGRATFSVVKTNYSREIPPLPLTRLEGGALQSLHEGEAAELDAEKVAANEARNAERVLWVIRKHPGRCRSELVKLAKMKKQDCGDAIDLLIDRGEVDEVPGAKGKKTYRFRGQQTLPGGGAE